MEAGGEEGTGVGAEEAVDECLLLRLFKRCHTKVSGDFAVSNLPSHVLLIILLQLVIVGREFNQVYFFFLPAFPPARVQFKGKEGF